MLTILSRPLSESVESRLLNSRLDARADVLRIELNTSFQFPLTVFEDELKHPNVRIELDRMPPLDKLKRMDPAELVLWLTSELRRSELRTFVDERRACSSSAAASFTFPFTRIRALKSSGESELACPVATSSSY